MQYHLAPNIVLTNNQKIDYLYLLYLIVNALLSITENYPIPHRIPVTHHYFITFAQSLYLNTNLPNLENQNGNYFPRAMAFFPAFCCSTDQAILL